MKGVLVVAHGSRAKETEKTLTDVLNMVKQMLPDLCIECAFMEFSDNTVEKGIKKLAEKNVTEIKVVPYFLFMGVHLKEDIPEIVEKCMSNYPHIKLAMGETLGSDKRLAEILADRIVS